MVSIHDVFSEDPNSYSYYFPIIIGISIILGILQLFILYLQDAYADMNFSLNHSLSVGGDYSITFITNKNSLKFRYMLAYLLTRASVWAKSPYIWSMYLFYHKFTIPEIGILYVIDAVSALVFGPITGNLADVFGRRRFCQFYNFSVCVNLALRLTGDHYMAYASQVVTGIGAGLANTSFESWVVSESIKEFRYHEVERERFLKKLFKSVNIFDACTSVIISALAAIFYTMYGVLAPIILSIIFSIASMIVIQVSWGENEIQMGKKSITNCYKEAFAELKKREVLCVGIAESMTLAVQNLFLFLWTPVLLASTTQPINIGFIFLCMVTSIICGTKIFEVGVIYLKSNLYVMLGMCLFFIFSDLMGIYLINSFLVRVVLFAALNGTTGLYTPLFSIIKYKILEEKHRALLMNIFRIPLNAYVIVVLLSLKYIDPFKVCLLASLMALVAFLSVSSLLAFRPSSKDGLSVFVHPRDSTTPTKKYSVCSNISESIGKN